MKMLVNIDLSKLKNEIMDKEVVEIYLIKFKKEGTSEIETYEYAFAEEERAKKRIESIREPFYEYWIEDYPII
jgi:hypothetical protein